MIEIDRPDYEWFVCPYCTFKSHEDPSVQSTWNRRGHMGLEDYLELSKHSMEPQDILGIKACPLHPINPPRPQVIDSTKEELRRFMERQRKETGGI